MNFRVVGPKINKFNCFHAETNDFDQQTACRAPVCWLKYTTVALPVLICHQVLPPKELARPLKNYYYASAQNLNKL